MLEELGNLEEPKILGPAEEDSNEPIDYNFDGQGEVTPYSKQNIWMPDRLTVEGLTKMRPDRLREDQIDVVITYLAKKFQALRYKLMKNAFKERPGYSHITSVPGNWDEFFNDEDRHYNPFPNKYYFEEEMLPTLQIMSKGNPQTMLQIGNDALRCLAALMCQCGNTDVFGGLVHNFFKPCGKEDLDEEGKIKFWYEGHGDKAFQYLYEKYGRLVALVAAQFQGLVCDLHYDKRDYSWGMWQLEGMLGGFWNALPAEHRNNALELVLACDSHQRMEVICGELPGVVKKIQEKGKGHLLGYFFRLAKVAALSVDIDSPSRGREAFPVLNSKMVLRELGAIERLPALREEAVNFAELVIERSPDKYNPIRPTFIKKKKRDNDDIYHIGGLSVNVRDIVDKLSDLQRRKGMSDEEVREILQLPNRMPSVGFIIVDRFEELSNRFPGGISALVKYLEDFKCAPHCAFKLVSYCAENMLPKANVDTFLEMGTKAVLALKDGASAYFESDKIKPPMMKVLEESPREFRTLVNRGIDFALKFGDYNTKLVFSEYSKFCLDPGFKAYKKGMLVLLDKVKRLKAQGVVIPGDVEFFGLLHGALKHYSEVQFAFSDKCYGLYKLPPDVKMMDHARIIAALDLDKKEERHGSYRDFTRLVKMGMDYRLAAMLRVDSESESGEVDFQRRIETYRIRRIKGIGCNVPSEKIRELAVKLSNIKNAIANVYGCGVRDMERKKEQIEHMPRNRAIAELPHLSTTILDTQLEVLDSLERDPEIRDFIGLKDLREEIESARSLAFFKDLMGNALAGGFNIGTKELDVPQKGLMATGSQSTRTLIAMTSTLSAIGAMKLEGGRANLERLPIDPSLFLAHNPRSGSELSAILKRYEGGLIRNIREAIPVVERQILQERKRIAGLMPIGGKIHTQFPMSDELIRFLNRAFGLEHTIFQLIHAGGSLLLPPAMSGAEIRLMLQALKALGVTGDEPDYQFCGAGEQKEDVAAIMGSSILLSATRAIPYAKGAFSTSHPETGARIMTFGAGVKEEGLPFDIKKATNRLDMLAQHDPFGFDRYQLLTTLANHERHNGRFGDLMRVYSEKLKKILYENGLLQFLNESAWVFDHKRKGDSLEDHERMVGRFMRAWKDASNKVDLGVIRKVNELLMEMERAIQAEKEALIREKPDDYHRLLTI